MTTRCACLERMAGIGLADESADAVDGLQLCLRLRRLLLLLPDLEDRLGPLLLGRVRHAEGVEVAGRRAQVADRQGPEIRPDRGLGVLLPGAAVGLGAAVDGSVCPPVRPPVRQPVVQLQLHAVLGPTRPYVEGVLGYVG